MLGLKGERTDIDGRKCFSFERAREGGGGVYTNMKRTNIISRQMNAMKR